MTYIFTNFICRLLTHIFWNPEKLSTSYSCTPSVLLFCEHFVVLFISFYRYLCYNQLIIQDILLCIARYRIHLHPLWCICKNFPITLRIYFLCSAWSLPLADSSSDTSASANLLSESGDSDSSLHCCPGCSDDLFGISHISGYWILHFLFFATFPCIFSSLVLSHIINPLEGIPATFYILPLTVSTISLLHLYHKPVFPCITQTDFTVFFLQIAKPCPAKDYTPVSFH